jgi:DNA topoisomerase-2
MSSATASKQAKSASTIYQKMEHAEHIYKKPDTYTGSCEQEDILQFIATTSESGETSIANKALRWTPAFYKCFDELLVNAYDHKKRMDKTIESLKTADEKAAHLPVSTIKVSVNEDQSISFYNDGDGILVEYMEEHKVYPPELIFGTLLTSTNYDDNEQREWGGRNGYGAKLANIFSKRFEVETICHVHKKKYKQTFEDNMTKRGKPKITDNTGKPYTKITWLPDYERFQMKTGLSEDIKGLIHRRILDIAGISGKTVKVYFQDKLIESRTFEKYAQLYLGEDATKTVVEESDGWSVVATASSDDAFEQVSFVNGIYTSRGGTHVDAIADQIKTKLAEFIKKKQKVDVKPQIIKNQMRLFINATRIVNPVFDSQTKETLKTPKSKFGGPLMEVSDKFIQNLAKTEILEKIIHQAQFKDQQLLTKTDGAKKRRVKVDKLCDANKAGTAESKKCTLILTEGDSAKTMAISGLAEVGRDLYGVYPLRGKILNVRDANVQQVVNCAVLNDIKEILGLQSGVAYTKDQMTDEKNFPLRYGRILLMTDQDVDGSHIKGLIMNLFDSLWGSLLQHGFICSMATPIVKAFRNNNSGEEKVFYTLQDYDKWKQEAESELNKWRIKYYKGLGTSSTKEAKEYFRNLRIVTYEPDAPSHTEESKSECPLNEDTISQRSTSSTTSSSSTTSATKKKSSKVAPDASTDSPTNRISSELDKAFNKKRADDRKSWLRQYNRNVYPDYSVPRITFGKFVDEELIHFSNEDNDRSIPSFMDGLKPSQRKVLFACFKRNLKQEIKVAQLAGYVSEHAAYHHGEVSLEHTIKNMAQDFIGSNNMNLLFPSGQFGSRIMGGQDAAQSRYIFTYLHPLTRLLFKKEDEVLCQYQEDDGFPIEPKYYYPILPTLLMNGATGIGTGFSTEIPCYHPVDLCNLILERIKSDEPVQRDTSSLRMWYRGFRGSVTKVSDTTCASRGVMEIVNDTTIRIKELPVGKWTQDYIEFLDKMTIERGSKDGKGDSKAFVKSYIDNSSEKDVDITIKCDEDFVFNNEGKVKDGIPEIERRLGIVTMLNTSNMHTFDESGRITKWNCVEDLIEHWYNQRLPVYEKRYQFLKDELKRELDIITYKVRFIQAILDEEFIPKNKKKQTVINELTQMGFPMIANTANNSPSYDYLMGMDFYKLTEEEIEDLKNKHEKKTIEYNELCSKHYTELWVDDINEFRESYVDLLKSESSPSTKNTKVTSSVSSGVTKKTKAKK